MKLNLKTMPAAALVALLAASSTQAALINGSFEQPTVTAGTYQTFAGGSSAITGWTILGNDSTVVSASYTESGILFPAREGIQWLDLTGPGTNSPNNGLSQSIATDVGQAYQLSFYVGSATDSVTFFPSTVDVSINGGPRTSFTNLTASLITLEWQQFTLGFTASGTSTDIAFFNGSGFGNNLSALDDVSVVTVPEPAAMAATIGLGAMACAIILRKRRLCALR